MSKNEERKLIIFDIDGTLLTSKHEVSESTIEVLQKAKEKGHELCIATGRSRVFAQDVLDSVGIENYILCNGSAAYVAHEQVYKKTLPSESLERLLVKALESKIDMAFQSMDETKRGSNYKLERMEQTMRSFGKDAPQLDEQFYLVEDIYQGLAFYKEDEQFFCDADFPEFRFVRWHEYGVDVLPQGGSKATTIQWLANHFSIPITNVVAFGDGENDKEMLQEVGFGIAMGNASPGVQSCANFVTLTNDEDGIWHAAQKLNLI